MAFTSYQVFNLGAFLSESNVASTLLSAVIRVLNYRHMQTRWFIPAIVSVASVASAQYSDVSRSALGSNTEAFELRNGEARTDLPQIKRVGIPGTPAFATVGNESMLPISPVFLAEFFNRYGMSLATHGFSFQSDAVYCELSLLGHKLK